MSDGYSGAGLQSTLESFSDPGVFSSIIFDSNPGQPLTPSFFSMDKFKLGRLTIFTFSMDIPIPGGYVSTGGAIEFTGIDIFPNTENLNGLSLAQLIDSTFFTCLCTCGGGSLSFRSPSQPGNIFNVGVTLTFQGQVVVIDVNN